MFENTVDTSWLVSIYFRSLSFDGPGVYLSRLALTNELLDQDVWTTCTAAYFMHINTIDLANIKTSG